MSGNAFQVVTDQNFALIANADRMGLSGWSFMVFSPVWACV